MTFNDEHNLEYKPMTMMEILNNPFHSKMTISPNTQIDLKKMAVKRIKSDWATGKRSLQKTLNGDLIFFNAIFLRSICLLGLIVILK